MLRIIFMTFSERTSR